VRLPKEFENVPCDKTRLKPGDEANFDAAVEFLKNERWRIPEAVVVKLASVGSFFRKTQNPHQPLERDRNIETVMRLIESGISGVHFNATDERGRRTGGADAYHALIDPCRERYGYSFVADCNVLYGDTFAEQLAPVLEGLAETSPLGLQHPRQWVEAAARVMEMNKCRPELIGHNSGEIELARRLLIEPGLVRKPYCWILLIGAPSIATRLMEYMPNPRAMLETLLLMVNRIREIDENSFIIVCTAGRASIYLTTAAMLLGLHVRIGTEDTMWKYPHRDEVIKDNIEVFEQTRGISELLGRRVATGNEYRQFIGLKPEEDVKS
jgi:uncharacterized protein (DUF849 family)